MKITVKVTAGNKKKERKTARKKEAKKKKKTTIEAEPRDAYALMVNAKTEFQLQEQCERRRHQCSNYWK